MFMTGYVHVGHKTVCRSQFLLSVMRVLGIKFSSSDLLVSSYLLSHLVNSDLILKSTCKGMRRRFSS